MDRTLNEKQRQVAENLTDNILLYASAGTGKTYTLAMRVANILSQGLAKAEEVLCLTFTVKACGEMRDDITAYAGEKAKNACIKTIHGFCYMLVREEEKRSGKARTEVSVCDDADEERLLRKILSARYHFWEYGVETEEEKTFSIYEKPTALRVLVSTVKHARLSGGIFSENAENDYQNALALLKERGEGYDELFSHYAKYTGQVCDEAFQSAMEKHCGRLIKEYDEYLIQCNQADYDDLVVEASRYLEDEATLVRWQTRYKYILVDEMQDTSETEYAILRKLFVGNNCMLCGDIFQTLYGWRGSNPHKVLEAFKSEFAPKVYTLSDNYRATEILMRAGYGYLQNTYPNLAEFFPDGLTARCGERGEKIRCYAFDNEEEEAWQVYNFVKRHGADGLCILARTNRYIATLYERFERFNAEQPIEERIKFFSVEAHCQFYKRSVIKDLLALFHFAVDSTDGVGLERLAERYIRGVGVATLSKLRAQSRLGVNATVVAGAKESDPYGGLIRAYERGEVVVYDTETTGLDVLKDEPVQISAIRLNAKGEIVDTLDLFALPTVPISKGAYDTHGFDEAYIRTRGGLSQKEALEKFAQFCKGATLVGHNSSRFDLPLLRRRYKAHGLPPLDIKGEYDTLTLAKLFLPTLKNHKLATLCERFSLVNVRAHDALSDITATAGVLRALLLEFILPTATARVETLKKYAPLFAKFNEFVDGVRGKIEEEEGDSLAQILAYAVASMRVESVYKGVGDAQAMETLKEQFAEAEARDGMDKEGVLQKFLAEASLSGSPLDARVTGAKRVPIVTVHQAKGCEFDTVIIVGADDGNFPAFVSKKEKDLEEEKRVFFVALTRAKKSVIMTRALYKYSKPLSPTRYFYKIPKECVETNAEWNEK